MRIETLRNSPSRTVAVDDAVISGADIAREVQNHAGGSPKQAWDEAARALVVRELLLRRARDLGIAAEPRANDGLRETDEEATIRALLEAEVRTPTADEATCRRYYMANPARFRGPDLFEPLHILFQAPRDDTAAYARAVEGAEAVLAELRIDPGRFEVLAKALSDCPSAAEGGRLGQIARGETTPDFEAALASLDPGQIRPEPVCTRYGVHVLRLDRKVAGTLLPFDQVRARIAHYLEERSWRRAVSQYLSLLARHARIEGVDLPGAMSPLLR